MFSLLLVWIGWIGLAAGVVYSAASGLYHLTNYIEKNPANIVIHAGLAIFDGYPILLLAYSILCQLSYCLLMTRFPLISPNSARTIIAFLMALGNHCIWFRYFMATYHGMDQIISFYSLIIWAIPVGLLVSMTATTGILPNYVEGGPSGKSRNLLGSLLGSLFSYHEKPTQDSRHLN